MKHIPFIFSILVAFCIGANAQTLPNGGFESWSSHSYATPDSSWYTSNPRSLGSDDSLTVWSVYGVTGHAVHIQTAIVGVDTLQAYIVNTPGDPKNGTGGVPYSQMPSSITGYYRYNLVGNDSALFWIEFKKAGAIVYNQIITFRGTGSVSTFTAFSFPLSLSVVPDTVIVAMASSNLMNGGLQSGSWLEIDNLAFGGSGITQPIQGGTFDNWTTSSFDIPTGWVVNQNGNGISGVNKSTDHYCGSYSVELMSPLGPSDGYVNVAQITNGHNSNNGPQGGLPYSLSIDTLTGYYKYIPVGADTGNIYVNLTNHGSLVGGFGYSFLSAASWTYFEIPFSTSTAPDTMLIAIQSGSWSVSHPGSALYLDCMQLKSQPLNLNNNDLVNNIIVYPNPVNDNLNIKVTENTTGRVQCLIYDVYGNVITNNNFNTYSSEISVDISKIASGIYFYEINNNGKSIKGKFVKN